MVEDMNGLKIQAVERFKEMNRGERPGRTKGRSKAQGTATVLRKFDGHSNFRE